MGLDIYFDKVTKEAHELAYFRKVNFLVAFFENLGYEIENCGEVVIEKEDIEELLSRCKQVLENKELATELLPTTEGFFFGSTEYDEYYFQDVEQVKDTCEELIPEFDELNGNQYIVFKIWY